MVSDRVRRYKGPRGAVRQPRGRAEVAHPLHDLGVRESRLRRYLGVADHALEATRPDAELRSRLGDGERRTLNVT
jgi:hypothetical protein